jgi:hypothetical protein
MMSYRAIGLTRHGPSLTGLCLGHVYSPWAGTARPDVAVRAGQPIWLSVATCESLKWQIKRFNAPN